jgi:glutathione S-transferase
VKDEVVLYMSPMSRGRMAHWMLEELAIPYRIELINLEKSEQKKAEFLAINPMGKVPAVTHRGTVVTECGAIMTYLADEFPGAGLAPPVHDPKRGAYLRWMFFAAACIDAAMIDKMLARPIPPERSGAVGYGRHEHVFDTLEKALTPGPYLLGEKFTAADLYVCGQLGFGLMVQGLEPRPVFQKYVESIQQRPACKRTNEKSGELIARMKAAS